MIRFIWITASVLLLIGCQSTKMLQLQTRSNVILPVRLVEPEKPFAVVIFSGGGSGTLEKLGNFPEEIAGAGMIAAGLGAPSDQDSNQGGMPPWFRNDVRHHKDIGAVVAKLRKDTDLPVWLAGLSFGTNSAASYASRDRPHPVDGIVLLSSVVLGGYSITDYLASIKIPVLAVAHKNDGCWATPASGAKVVIETATSSPNAKVIIINGGQNEGFDPCSGRVYHTFQGVRHKVASAISDFIKANNK